MSQYAFRTVAFYTMGTLFLLALTSVGRCQNTSTVAENSGPTEPIEEIVVYGSKSLLQFRLDLYKAEEAVFDLFNSLNSDDEFDIHCHKEMFIGSRLQRRVCKPNYVDLLTAEETSRSRLPGAGGISPTYAHAVTKIREKDK